jgi:apurinic endonuclease APN1
MIIGGNMSTIGGVSGALIMIHRLGGSAIQITLGALDDRKLIHDLSPEDIQKTNNIRQKYGYYVVVHGKYIYNFCRASWRSWQSEALFKELIIAEKIQADVVIHQGKNVTELNLTDSEALDIFTKEVCLVAERMRLSGLKNRILLENSSRQGTELGYSLEHLKTILDNIPDHLRDYFGFCIDTCHIFVAGEENWDHPSEFFQKFDRLIGLKHLNLVHLNDSAIPFNGRNDHHAGLEKGHISARLREVAKICAALRIPMILETPSEGLESEIKIIKNLYLK